MARRIGRPDNLLDQAIYNEPVERHAKVAELADAPDLGSGGAIHGGSSPPFRTTVITLYLKE